MLSSPWLDILVFLAIVIADAAGLVPITQTIFLLPLIWLSLRLRREAWSTLGFNWPERRWRQIGIAIATGIALELFAVYVTTPAISALLGNEPDYSDFKLIQDNLAMLFLFIALSWVLAAFGEELCFRGFLMKRIAQLLGEGRAAWIASLILSSILFGWGHTEQGAAGWMQEGLSGLWLGMLFLMAGRNLLLPIVAHGVSNTLAFCPIYVGRYPGIS